MWFDILKNQELTTSQLGGTLDWENPAIPEEEDDKCRKIIMAMIDRANEMRQKYPTFDYDFVTRIDITAGTDMGEMSEENICKALEAFKNLKGEDEDILVLRRGEKYFEGEVNKNFRYHGAEQRTSINIGDSVGYIYIIVDIYLDDYEDDSEDKKELVKEYQELCTYIFGEEYYSPDSKFG